MPVDDVYYMQRALELARRGEGSVEPNPMVGCVIVREGEIVGEGWHAHYGGPHAEIAAIRMAGDRVREATVFVSLEPCSHYGKTPPCVDALIAAQPKRVAVALPDPFPSVAGEGIAKLRAAGIAVDVGLCEAAARQVLAPYLMLTEQHRPWVMAKWAMTLDGKIATRTGDSRWISGEPAREIVQRLRARVDAVMVGAGTARMDDPLLTARPADSKVHRVATRIVVDPRATLPIDSQLAATVDQGPVLVFVSSEAEPERCGRLRATGVEVVPLPEEGGLLSERAIVAELGSRRMTNLLVEGGSRLLGSLADRRLIDEVHAFIAPKIIGGGDAATPLAGKGAARMSAALMLEAPVTEQVGDDVYLHGRLQRQPNT